MKKILFIGNIPDFNPNSIGGANTYTLEILKLLKNDKSIEVTFLKIRKRWYKFGQVIDYILFPFEFLKKVLTHDVISIHATWDFHLTLGPFLVLFSKLLNKKVVYHFFGGKFHLMYDNYPFYIKKWLDVSIFKANYKLVETKRMMDYFERKNCDGMIWFPNSRKEVEIEQKNQNYSKRFVFISRVTPTKGIDYIIEAAKNLSKDYLIHIFGPLDARFYNTDNLTLSNVKYMGVLSPQSVTKTLQNYDVLLLPSFHDGEGYPGIFIEAMSVGKPIISTDWNSLDELVEDGFNGVLIPIKSSTELKKAIENFNVNNYYQFSNNAKEKFKDFNIDKIVNKLTHLY